MTEPLTYEDMSVEFRQAKNLHEIRPDFYIAAKALVARVGDELENAIRDGEPEEVIEMYREQYVRYKRTLTDIAQLRADTLARLVGNAPKNSQYMTPEELAYYQTIQSAKREFIQGVLP